MPLEIVAVFGAGLTAKVVELLKVAECKVTDVFTHECKDVIRHSPPQIWTPEVPVHSVIEPSEFVLGIMEFVEVGLCTREPNRHL